MFKDLCAYIDSSGGNSKKFEKFLKKKENAETRATDDFGEGLSERSEVCEENYQNLEKLL